LCPTGAYSLVITYRNRIRTYPFLLQHARLIAINTFMLQLRKISLPGRWARRTGIAVLMTAGNFAIERAEGPWWMQAGWLALAGLCFFFTERGPRTVMSDNGSPEADDRPPGPTASSSTEIDLSSGAIANRQSNIQDYRHARFDNARVTSSITRVDGLDPRLAKQMTVRVVMAVVMAVVVAVAIIAGPRFVALFRDATPPPVKELMTGCEWKIIRETVGVFEEPRKDAPRIKNKVKDALVGPYCDIWTNPKDGTTYVPVKTTSADDGIGWIDASTLARA
jgi:hypothetical protein